jgi:hypothetical protein
VNLTEDIVRPPLEYVIECTTGYPTASFRLSVEEVRTFIAFGDSLSLCYGGRMGGRFGLYGDQSQLMTARTSQRCPAGRRVGRAYHGRPPDPDAGLAWGSRPDAPHPSRGIMLERSFDRSPLERIAAGPSSSLDQDHAYRGARPLSAEWFVTFGPFCPVRGRSARLRGALAY